ncbi:hypothetical protein TWF718_004580 [Orbilia javanica]|uniref:Uncharacterized protein n=1 Tax=Orbilia javanica TaxID=47235 RepID=A0AAN8NBQ7_9PEZI
MTLARGLLISAWLSLVFAVPLPQGGGGGGDNNSQGIVGSGGGAGGIGDLSDTSSESDSSISIPGQPQLQPETGGYLRTTAQTRQFPTTPNNNNNNAQTLGGTSPINRFTGTNGGTIGSPGGGGLGGSIGPDSGSVGTGGGRGLDTSLRKIFSGGSPLDSGRRGSNTYNNNNNNNNPVSSTFNGRLAPPGMFSQPPESQTGWPWEYIERLPPQQSQVDNSLGISGPIKLPQQLLPINSNNFQDQTRVSSPYNSNPPTVRLSGVREGIYRGSGQLGSTFSRERKFVQQQSGVTPPVGSSKVVNYSPSRNGGVNNYGTPGNTGRDTRVRTGSPYQNTEDGDYEYRDSGGRGEEEEEVDYYGGPRQGFVESYRSQYPEFAETIEFVTDGDRNYSPEKKILEEFKFTTTNPTPRIQTPPMVDFGRFGASAGGDRRGGGGTTGGRGFIVDRRESDLLPVDLENVLARYVDTEDEGVISNNGGYGAGLGKAETKASCDVTDVDCIDNIGGEILPLASRVTRQNGNFEVRNPGRLAGADTGRAVPGDPRGLQGGTGNAGSRYPSMKGPRFTVQE